VLGWVLGATALVSITACGSSAATGASPSSSSASAPAATPGGLTPFQVEHGIGPVTSPVTLNGAVDASQAQLGAKVFELKCSSCHKMGERYVGPPLGAVLERRTPTFVMNMVLNPQEMVEKHPVTKKLLGEFFIMMPNQNLSPSEARQVLEYLRTQKP
jgi:cytochrome c1